MVYPLQEVDAQTIYLADRRLRGEGPIHSSYAFTPTQLQEQPELVRSSRCFGRSVAVGRRDCVPAGDVEPAETAPSRERTCCVHYEAFP
jgi:hypothetical protein